MHNNINVDFPEDANTEGSNDLKTVQLRYYSNDKHSF